MGAYHGFTLIEVLISILVLAIGMFGAAALQLTAIRTTQQSSMHTAALSLASDIADNMRMNDVVMNLDDASNPFLKVAGFDATSPLSEPAKFCNLSSAVCSADELANFDIYEWQWRMQKLLPTGRAVICRDSNPWDTKANRYKWACGATGTGTAPITVKIVWQGKNADGSLERLSDGTFAPQVALIVAPYSK